MTTSLAPLQTDPWASRFIDVERLNDHASSFLRARLDDVRTAATAGELLSTASVAVLGAAGAGKTHVFARLRRNVGARGCFVLVRPLLGAEPTLRLLLIDLMDQLRRPSFGGSLSQLETLVGGALASRARFPSTGLTDAAFMNGDERAARVGEVLADLFALRPELEGATEYARRLLELPFERSAHRGILAAWLSGRDVDPEAAREAGLPGPLSDVDVLRALTIVSALASVGAPLLIAFDQLENLADATGHRVRAHGNLVAELVDQVPALTLVQLALTGEWIQHIQPALSLPQRTRIAEQTVILQEPSIDDRRNLVRAWLGELPKDAIEDGVAARLNDADIERWCLEPGMTPRMLLQACRRAIATDAPPPPASPAQPAPDEPVEPDVRVEDPPPVEHDAPTRTSRPRAAPKKGGVVLLDGVLARAWKSAVRGAQREIREAHGDGRLVDVERLAEVLSVTIARDEGTALVWRRGSGASPVLIGSLASSTLQGSVVLVQGHHPRSVATALERARELTDGPVLFVRQGSFDFPATWREVQSRVAELQGLTRTCWLALSDDVLAHGLAFATLRAAARSGELTGPDGEAVSEVTLLAWSSAALGDSIRTLDEELRRVFDAWRPRAPEESARQTVTTVPEDPTPPRPSLVLGEIGALVDLARERWPWSERPLRWLRTMQGRARTARETWKR